MYTEGGIAAELLRRRRGNENREPLMEEISEKHSLLTLNIFLFRYSFICIGRAVSSIAFTRRCHKGELYFVNRFFSVFWFNAYSAILCTIAPCYFCPFVYK